MGRQRSRDNKTVKRRSRSPRDQSVNKDEERIVRYRSLSSTENSKNKRDKSEDDRVIRNRSEEGKDRDGVKQERSGERKDRNGSRRDRSEERKEKSFYQRGSEHEKHSRDRKSREG